MESGAKKCPGFTGKAYPEVFTVAPPQPQQLKPGQLSKEQVKKFFDEVLTAEVFFIIVLYLTGAGRNVTAWRPGQIF